MTRSILIVDDEPNMRLVMEMALEDAAYRVLTAASGEDAIPLLGDPDLDLILTDLKMPGMGGEAFIARAKLERPDIPVIVVTAFGSIRSAIETMQAGAVDYLTKPFEPEELQFAVHSGLRLRDLWRENARLKANVEDQMRTCRLVGDSAAMQRVREQVGEVAPYQSNVLITGESGTGKEAVARAIHERGPRAQKPWVAINCAAIPGELMESELFGYVKGAYTGATRDRLGRLEQASGGTLFLDEIGDLELNLQGKLLRVLQEREYSPVGSDAIRRADVRVIAATNRDLRALVAEGEFREDLYYRLDVYNIDVPPLRERRDDIPSLAAAFLKQLRADINKPVTGFTPNAIARLQGYHWPGNVRELRNAVERSLLSCRGSEIRAAELPDRVLNESMQPVDVPLDEDDLPQDLDAWLAELERRRIIAALEASDGVQVQAAKRLGISERSLWHRLKKLEIQVERAVKR